MSDPMFPPPPAPEPPHVPNIPAAPPPYAPPPGPAVAVDSAGAPLVETSVGLAPNIAAALACFFSFVGGLVFLILEKKNAFVRFYAMQALIFGAVYLAYSIAMQILGAFLFHIPGIGWLLALLFGLVSMVVGLVFLAFTIVTIIQAFQGKEWEIPYIGKIARQQLAKPSIPI